MKNTKAEGRKSDRMGAEDQSRKLGIITTGGLIFLMLLYLVLTLYSSTKLAEHTEFISSHPFEVVIAAGDVKTYLSEIQIRTERLTKYNSPSEVGLVRDSLESIFDEIEEPLETIKSQFLGDPNDVRMAEDMLAELEAALDDCLARADQISLQDLEAYEAKTLQPLYEQIADQIDEIMETAQARKLWYGKMAEQLRKRTLICSMILIILMIGGLLLSQYVLRRQRMELVRRGLLFDNLSQSIDDAFVISNAGTGEIYYSARNASRVLGHPIDKLADIGRGFSGEDMLEIEAAMEDAGLEEPYTKEAPYTFPNGEQRYMTVRIYRVKGLAAPQVICTFSDCTEQIRSRQTLQDAMMNAERANEAKSVFLSRMSHEIRTPLNAIIGMTTIAAAAVKDPAKVQDCLGKISFSSKHLLMLVNDVLDMSKIESNKMMLQKEPFDLFQLINSYSATIYTQARDKGIDFEEVMEGFEGEAQYLGDSLRLNQILLNLGSNAVKFTPSGGQIRLKVKKISSKKSMDTVRFVLQDTGIGMSEDAIERIFKPFEQADSSIAGRFGGTGLGMSITKNLVTLMDGRIEVKSKPGKCTTCIVDLPIQRSTKQEIQPDFANQGLRALVVDDEQAVCEETTALLENIKIQADWVLNGNDAVCLVTEAQKKNCEYDFCLIDWKMPDMDGIEVTRRIRANVGNLLPIVMISAYDYTEIEEEARSAGVNAFLPKPLYRSSVYATVMGALSKDKGEPVKVPGVEGETKCKRLLVAEDNELNREILVELLGMNGIQAACASNGEEVLNLFVKSVPGFYDAILMDVQMPVMDGYEATRLLRASGHPDAQKIPIIATTANAFSDDVLAALAAGMNAHISKPIDFEHLSKLLSENVS